MYQDQTVEDSNSVPDTPQDKENVHNETVAGEFGRSTIRRLSIPPERLAQTGKTDELDMEIVKHREALLLFPPGHPDRPMSHSNLGMSLLRRFDQTRKVEDLEEAIVQHREALLLRPPGNSDRNVDLNHLGISLFKRFLQTGMMEDLEEAIIRYREALVLRPPGNPDRYVILNNLGISQFHRFKQTGMMEDLEEAIAYHREQLLLRPPGHSNDSFRPLGGLGDLLRKRFEQTGNMENLEEAISIQRETLHLLPHAHPNHSVFLNTLGDSLCERFRRTGRMEDLEEAIFLHREALILCPNYSPARSFAHDGLGDTLSIRFKQTGEMTDIDEAIIQYREALLLRPPGHPDRAKSLSNLGASLRNQFERKGEIGDLEEAIAQHREALLLCPPGNPHRFRSLNNLGISLHDRFLQTGNVEDIEEAIAQHREALLLCPPGHPDHSMSLNNLGNLLPTQFELRGNMEDIEEAIAVHREALPLLPPGHPNRFMSLISLGISLNFRFGQTGKMEDLEEAIAQYHEVLLLLPPNHPSRATSLNNLAISLLNRFKQTGKMEDLEESIVQHREAFSLLPPGHPNHSMFQNNLGNVLGEQFSQTGKMEYLEEAITHLREALLLHPDDPHRSKPHINLGVSLHRRFEQTGKIEDLKEAMVQLREALRLLPIGHPNRSMALQNLAFATLSRVSQESEIEGLDLSFDLWQQAVTDHYASPLLRFQYAKKWAVLAMHYHHKSVLKAYSHAIILLNRCLVATPTIDSQQDFLARKMGSLPYDAVSCAIQAGKLDTAVELFEQGRSLLWSRMNSFRHPIESLYAIDHKLAEQFQRLTTELEHLTTSFTSDLLNSISASAHPPSHVSFNAKMQHHRKLSEELLKIIDEIRGKEGFQDFLQSVPFERLKALAFEGPVIIVNISRYSSDAIILYQANDIHSLVSIPLVSATPAFLNKLALGLEMARSHHPVDKSSIFQFLRELWQAIVGPVTDKLSEMGIQQKSRVWWCPTSMLCALPLHAAGPYTPGKKNFPDIYISSYTPTLSALIKARTPANNLLSAPKLLAIGISDENELHDVEPRFDEELARISYLSNMSVTQLDGEKAIPDVILLELQQHPWVHFACHGHSDVQPFLSSFELNLGQRLTLLQLIKARLPNAEFAFLSACHSAAGGSSTPDENIHLSAALQFCGFRSTIGTLWSMADEDGPMIVEEFYKHLFLEGKTADYRDTARALNEATRAMRQHKIPIDRWICFVHIGA